jgi:hypothetical protein
MQNPKDKRNLQNYFLKGKAMEKVHGAVDRVHQSDPWANDASDRLWVISFHICD